MKVKIGNELLLLNILVILLIAAIILFPSNIVRVILGLPFLLFIPGYALIAALFPKKEGIGGVERIALSLAISLAVVPLVGLGLNTTPWGIRLEPILYSIASFIFITSTIAWLRRRRLLEPERFRLEWQLRTPPWLESMWRGSGWNRVLAIAMAVAILGALGTITYTIATPKAGESLTEFYILGKEGQAIDYPAELKLGETGEVMVTIINQEHRTVGYRVEVMIDGVKNNGVGPIVLENKERWQGEVSFTPEVAGMEQKVEFLLYEEGTVAPSFEPLRLWVDVIE